MQAHCQSRTSRLAIQALSNQPTGKQLKKLVPPLRESAQDKIVFNRESFRDPALQKNKKMQYTTRHKQTKNKQTMTVKPNNDNGLHGRPDRTPAANTHSYIIPCQANGHNFNPFF